MSKLDALLINPISARSLPAFLPHGLLYIAAYAKRAGQRVKIFDRNVQDRGLQELLEEEKPRVVGLGCLTGTSIDDAIFVSKFIRNKYPDIKIVWGGIHPSLYPDSILLQEYVDYVIIGDGESAFSRLIAYIINGNLDLKSIDNLGYKEKGQLYYNKSSFTDMQDLPQPAWELIDVEKYIRSKFYANRVLTINTSRGCPYRCSFCCVPKVHKGNWRAVSAGKIIENLKILIEKYGIDGFQVDDDEFDIDRKRVLELCALLKKEKLNLKWSHFSRINIVNESVLREEIDCGLKLIEFGVESGSERMLKFLKKGQTVKQIRDAYSICRKLRLKTSALFMTGLPTEEASELKETVRLVKSLNPHQTICTIFKPYPGTELFDFCVANNLFSYPSKLDEVGSIYMQNMNMSKIPDKLISRVKGYFDFKNIYQEIANCILTFNFRLLVYYFRYKLLGG
jgi:radical SAM superfamily enzyme YgiQ (UPF0313 family)